LREKGIELTGASAEHKALLDVIGGLELKQKRHASDCRGLRSRE
jgi:hypothetical protein